MPKGQISCMQQAITDILEDAENGLPMLARALLHDLWQEIKGLNQEILKHDRQLYQLSAIK